MFYETLECEGDGNSGSKWGPAAVDMTQRVLGTIRGMDERALELVIAQAQEERDRLRPGRDDGGRGRRRAWSCACVA